MRTRGEKAVFWVALGVLLVCMWPLSLLMAKAGYWTARIYFLLIPLAAIVVPEGAARLWLWATTRAKQS